MDRITEDDIDAAATAIIPKLLRFIEIMERAELTGLIEPAPRPDQEPRRTTGTPYACALCGKRLKTTEKITRTPLSRRWIHLQCWNKSQEPTSVAGGLEQGLPPTKGAVTAERPNPPEATNGQETR